MYVFGIRVSASFKRIKPLQELKNVSRFIYRTSIYLIFCILFKLSLIKKQKWLIIWKDVNVFLLKWFLNDFLSILMTFYLLSFVYCIQLSTKFISNGSFVFTKIQLMTNLLNGIDQRNCRLGLMSNRRSILQFRVSVQW